MSPVGKILFSLIGIFYLGILGFFAGLIIGHVCVDENDIVKRFVDRHPRLRKLVSEFSKLRIRLPSSILDLFVAGRRYQGNPFETAANLREARDVTFIQSVAGLISEMSNAEIGTKLYYKELETFYDAFVVPPYMVRQLNQIFDKAKVKKNGYEGFARQIKIMLPDSPFVKNDVVRLLFRVANLDGKISSFELDFLRRVSVYLGVPNSEFAKITAEYGEIHDDSSYERVRAPSFSKDPYRVIGVDRSFKDEEIKKVYRDLIRTNHPDTLMACGASKEEIDAANRFMAEVNSAYDLIEKERRRKN